MKKKSDHIALAYFNKAIKLDSKNESAYFAAGEIYKKRGDCKEAIKKYKQVLKINKRAFLAHIPIAQCYKSLSNTIAATKNYKAFIKRAESVAPRSWHKQISYAKNEITALSP